MSKFKKLIGTINTIEPPKGLESRILARIKTEERRLAKAGTLIFASMSAASLGFSLWAAVYLMKGFAETGFWQYLSLIFSENGVILSYWRELSLSLVESLPIVSLVMFLAAVGFFIWSLANMMKRNILLSNTSFI